MYRESGVILSAEREGSAYVESARANAEGLGYRVEGLEGREAVGRALGTGGEGGESGYVNWGSGWADAGRAMGGCLGGVVGRARERNEGGKGRGKVVFRRGRAGGLVFRDGVGGKRRVVGARLEGEGGEEIRADLTVVAAGAWSGALVDLRGRAEARGQVLAYVPVSGEEKEKLARMPVVLNLSTGMFAIPPVECQGAGPGRRWAVKVARHSFGYANPTAVAPEGESIVTSLPARTFSPIPTEGERACQAFLQKTIPWLADRAFDETRICWYSDTPTGNFLIDYHPGYEGLFLATGGSGHGFKFLPVLGDRIVEAVEGRLEGELRGLWRWEGEVDKGGLFGGCGDGSRRGERGMLLGEEWGREGRRSRL